MVQCSAAFPGPSIADFFKPGKIDHTPVKDIAGFKDLDATFLELQNKKKTATPDMRSVVSDFVRMYSEVLDRQTKHEYVNVSWANALQWVVPRVLEFERENEKQSWLALWTNASVLQTQSQKFKHEYRFLEIAKCFYPLT